MGKLETQERQLWSFGPKTGRFKTHDSVFQLGSKSRQNPTSQFKHNQAGFTLSQGRGINWKAWIEQDEGHSHYRGQSDLLKCIDLNVNLIQNTLTKTPKIKFDQISRHPVAQPNWHIKLTSNHGRGRLKRDKKILLNLQKGMEKLDGQISIMWRKDVAI